jgi:ATP-dependent Lhr-like helicase
MIDDGRLALDRLFEEDMLGDDLDAWLAQSSLMKRTFRFAAVIAGLIERRHPGVKKSGRQVTMSTDLIYDVLRKHEPGHILLEAAWADAATGLLDIRRLGDFLGRIKGRIRHQPLDRVSPLSVPILLEIGKEPVAKHAREDLLRDAALELIREATEQRSDLPPWPPSPSSPNGSTPVSSTTSRSQSAARRSAPIIRARSTGRRKTP